MQLLVIFLLTFLICLSQAVPAGSDEIVEAGDNDYAPASVNTKPLPVSESRLLRAAREGSTVKVLARLALRDNPNVVDTKGKTPLDWAIEHDKKLMMSALLKSGADPNPNERPYWWWAIEHDALGFIKAFIAKGEDVDALDSGGHAPLDWAVKKGRTKIVKVLLAAKANPNIHSDGLDEIPPPLISSIHHQVWPIFDALLAAGANVNILNRGISPLHLAGKYGNPDVVAKLLARGGKVDARDPNNMTPLMWADSVQKARLLLNAGAAVDAVSEDGDTALRIAAERGNVELAKFLLKRGANANVNPTTSPLHDAVKQGDVDMVHSLVQGGANVNAATTLGETALMMCSCVKIAQILIDAGADVDAAQVDGKNALFFTLERFLPWMATFLVANGAAVNTLIMGRTLLREACERGNIRFIQIFLQAGADVNAVNGDGLSSLEWAEVKGFKRIANLLKGGSYSSAAQQGNVGSQRKIGLQRKESRLKEETLEEECRQIVDCFANRGF